MTTTYPKPWPKLTGCPVLDSLRPVIDQSKHVQTHPEKITEIAHWMAYEELPMPDYALPCGIDAENTDETIDFILTVASIDTAFTDFTHHIKFQVEYAGKEWSDSDALFACVKRAMDLGVPILDGTFLSQITRPEMERIFRANIELPMLDEKMQILHQVGLTLVAKYKGRFHHFVKSCSCCLYDQGNGLMDRLITEFPRFNDTSTYHGNLVKIYKLPQLALWFLYTSLRKSDALQIKDIDKMTAFADYIVPVALRLLGITSYSPDLERTINSYQLIPRDSDQEIEIRAHCIYALALLAEEINALRPPDLRIIMPQLDARLWTHYHTTWWPHHLTRTIMY
jgi:hypothetical protein